MADQHFERFYHCRVKLQGKKSSREYSVLNDITWQELQSRIVLPWHLGKPFTVAGTVVSNASSVEEIQIVHTTEPQQHFADRHNERMRSSGIADMATDRKLLPFSGGTDLTYDLLFSGNQSEQSQPSAPDTAMIVRLCQRIRYAAKILEARQRKNKQAYVIEDEYDVQDLLHSIIRAYIKFSVQEDPLGKVAGTKSGRADISIEELGVLIEVKYVHGPEDQKRIFEDFSQDLVLYPKWTRLTTLIFLIYNSDDLRDPEALQKLAGVKEISGKRFDVKIVLA